MNKERLLPLTGVAFVVLLIASFAIGGEPPTADEGAQEIVDFYVDNKDAIMISSIIGSLSLLSFVFFIAYLRRRLEAADGETGIVTTTLVIGAAVLATGAAIDGTILFALAEAAEDIDPVAVQALQALWDNDFLPMALGLATVILSAGIGVVKTGLLPKWLGWIAIILAVVSFTPAGFIAFLGSALWILVASILLSVRASTA
jgi:hypothetical protein